MRAHRAGVKFLRESSVEFVPEYMDAAITSAAGNPLDLTFYQTIKGITAVQHIVKPGGKILVVSACSEGVGSPEFAEMLRSYPGAGEFLDEIKDSAVKVDQWQLEKLALVELKHPVLFYVPGVERDELGALGERSFGSIDEAIAALLSGLPDGARVAVLPDGPYAYARVQASEEPVLALS